MTRKRRALALSILALLTVLGFCLWLGCQEFPQQFQRLPDGETVRLLGVTHPGKPALMTGPPLLRLLAPAIPVEHHERFGLTTWPDRGSAPFTVWLRFGDGFGFDSPTAKVNGVLRVWDEKGNCSTERLGSLLHMDDYPVYPMEPGAFPRRGRELRLALFGDDGKGHVDSLATFKVANPLHRNYPEWKAWPLPDRQQDRELVVTLERLDSRLPDKQASSALYGRELLESGLPVWTEATLSIHESGRLSNDWRIQSISFQDATGNRIEPEYKLERMSDGMIKVRFPGNLWGEPAWRVVVNVYRVRNPPPSQRLLYRVRIPNVGENGSVRYLSKRRSPLRVGAVFGPNGVQEDSALAALLNTKQSGLIAESDGAWDEEIDLVSIQVGGRRREVFVEGSGFDDQNLWYSLGKTPPGNALLTFAIRDKREFMFYVRPTIH